MEVCVSAGLRANDRSSNCRAVGTSPAVAYAVPSVPIVAASFGSFFRMAFSSSRRFASRIERPSLRDSRSR